MARKPSSHKHSRRSSPKPRPPGLWGKDTLLIERMSQEGRGIANRAGKVVFVTGALAGEEVRVQCTAVKRDYDEADTIELVAGSAPSTLRVQPQCPIYQQCGGCSLQHWSIAAQQKHKQSNLLAMLHPIVPGLVLDPPLICNAAGYRHRLRLMVTRQADRHYALGLRQHRSHDTVNLQHCLVANFALNTLLKTLPDMLLTAPDLQGLREIEIDADGSNRIGLCFYFAAHPGEKVLSGLRTAIMVDPVVALRVRLNPPGKTHAAAQYDEHGIDLAENWQELLTEGELCFELGGATDQASNAGKKLLLAYLPGDFTQTHWEVNAELVSRGLDWLQPGGDEHALDLFSGIGNFSLPLALRAKTVQALEGDSSMTQRVVTNAGRNGVENLKAKTLNLMADEVALPGADITIVDPPRAGAKAVCAALARSRLRRLLYVSCHPATLARDARVLHSAGLHLTRAAAVDMFPHTGHSEAMALFERK